MNNYHVDIIKQGKKLTTDMAVAKSPLDAIKQTEKRFNLNPMRVQMADNGHSKVVEWSGYEFVVRQI